MSMITTLILIGIAAAIILPLIYFGVKRLEKKKLEGKGTPTQTPPPPVEK